MNVVTLEFVDSPFPCWKKLLIPLDTIIVVRMWHHNVHTIHENGRLPLLDVEPGLPRQRGEIVNVLISDALGNPDYELMMFGPGKYPVEAQDA